MPVAVMPVAVLRAVILRAIGAGILQVCRRQWSMAVRWPPGLMVAGLVMAGLVVAGGGRAQAQSLTAAAGIDNGIVAAEAAMDSARSISRLAGKIKDLARQAQRGVTAPQTLADQAASLGQQIDILASDAAFRGINLIGLGARAHQVTAPGRRQHRIPAMLLTSGALDLSRFDFGSATGIRSALVRSDHAQTQARKAAATYAGHAETLRTQRPSGAIGRRPAPLRSTTAPSTGPTGAAGGLDIDALHNRLGIKK